MSTASDLPEWDAEVVALHPGALVDEPGGGVVDLAPNAWTARWANQPIIASTREDLARSARWHARAFWRQVAWFLTHAHVLVWRELRPIAHGLVDLVRTIRRWQRCAGDRERLDATETRDVAEKLWEKRYASKVVRRFWCLFVAFLLVVGLGWWGYLVYGLPVPILAGFVVVGVADVLGRRTHPVEDPASPPAMPILIDDPDVPLSQLQLAILEVFEREGFVPGAVGVAMPLRYDPIRLDYRMIVSCPDEIAPKHLRAIERAIGASDFAVRCLATETATNRLLVIRRGDPLANVPAPSWIDTGARSIATPLDLGESAGDVPMDVVFAGIHAEVIGKTGSGKSAGALWAIIDRLSACRDVVMWGIDLAQGPALPMWRGVIQRTAYSPADADTLLEDALEVIEQRMRVLTEIAEDDDPSNDTDTWHSGLGPALVIVVDEFAILASYQGEKGRENLLAKVEVIVRTGRKVWVTLVVGTQKAGNSDLGSTVMASQFAVKILLACTERDTVALLGTEARDKGWAPHHLRPSVPGDPRDAGKCYLDSPAHRTPDIYRFWSPLSVRDVKQRARQRMLDGLPTLDGGTTADTVEVPDVLAFIEARFGEAKADELASAAIVAGTEWTQASLAEALKPYGVMPGRIGPRDSRARGYRMADVKTAIRGLA